MKWEHEMCDWDGLEGRICGLRKGHTPLKAWPFHAPTPLFHLGELLGTTHFPKRLDDDAPDR